VSWKDKFEDYKFTSALLELPHTAEPDLRRRLEVLACVYGNAGFMDGNLGYLAEIVVDDTLQLFDLNITGEPMERTVAKRAKEI
jgi:hypothetical protein